MEILFKQEDETYRVKSEIYHNYRSYSKRKQFAPQPHVQKKEPKIAKIEEDDIGKWVAKWRDFKNLSFSLDVRHFFLEGTYLDDLSKDLIRQAKSEVLLVNPYIQQCHLSNTLLDAITNKAKVIVVTRPILKTNSYHAETQTYHNDLEKKGVQFNYDRHIHAKLLVVDQRIAVISSMNFIVFSTGGSSWEAGMISIDKKIVNSVTKSIYGLLKKIN